MMRTTKVGHSCLIFESGTTKILIDPGKYSFKGNIRPEELEGLNAILITHSHKDHADPEAIKNILGKNKVQIYGNAGTKEELAKSGISVELFEDRTMNIGSVQIESMSAEHGFLLAGKVQNTAYLLNHEFLITGDSLDSKLVSLKTRVLAVPVLAPWMDQEKASAFLREMSPEIILPIHDGFVLPDFLEGQYKAWSAYADSIGSRFITPELGKTMQF